MGKEMLSKEQRDELLAELRIMREEHKRLINELEELGLQLKEQREEMIAAECREKLS